MGVLGVGVYLCVNLRSALQPNPSECHQEDYSSITLCNHMYSVQLLCLTNSDFMCKLLHSLYLFYLRQKISFIYCLFHLKINISNECYKEKKNARPYDTAEDNLLSGLSKGKFVS